MPGITLSAQDIARYHVEGFLVLPPLTDAAEIGRIRAIYDDLFAREVGHERGEHFDLYGDETSERAANTIVPQILGPEKYAPELRDTKLWANGQAVAQQLFGALPEGFGAHAILKPANCPKSTPWHQDESYWGKATDHCAFSMWIPLQDVDERSGCMHFVPRSHWGEIVPHRSAEGNVRIHGLEVTDDVRIDPAEVVAAPLPAGGATIHHQRMLHMTTPNLVDRPRRALILVARMGARNRHVPKELPWLDALKTARVERQRAFQDQEKARQLAKA